MKCLLYRECLLYRGCPLRGVPLYAIVHVLGLSMIHSRNNVKYMYFTCTFEMLSRYMYVIYVACFLYHRCVLHCSLQIKPLHTHCFTVTLSGL